MKNELRYAFAVCAFGLALSSCTTLIERWPDQSEEKGDRVIACEKKADVFSDFLWTTPPVYSRKMEVRDNRFLVSLGGKELSFQANADGSMTLEENRRTTRSEVTFTEGTCYYNIDVLGTKLALRSRYVPVTESIMKQVPVYKSRQVARTYPVMKTRTVYDALTHTSRLETYTDMETRWETEFYTDWEMRSVTETTWAWKLVPETVVDIPSFSVFAFPMGDGGRVLVYRVRGKDEDEYYFQNPAYLYAVEKQDAGQGIFGASGDLAMLVIDANANGSYVDDDDMILFNSWNPYQQGSSYRDVGSFMDNSWYRLGQLRMENFISFSTDAELRQLTVKNANSSYIDSEETGKIVIRNVTDDMTISLNGKEYGLTGEGVLKGDIELGVYQLRIVKPGHLDFKKTFTVDGASREVDVSYVETPLAGTFIVKNHGFRSWKLTLQNDKGGAITLYNANEVSVEAGHYAIGIVGNNVRFDVNLDISPGMIYEYDFAADKVESRTAK